MSRRTVLMALTATVLLGGLAAPALADPLPESEPTVVCLRLDGPDGERDGVCVWVPVGR